MGYSITRFQRIVRQMMAFCLMRIEKRKNAALGVVWEILFENSVVDIDGTAIMLIRGEHEPRGHVRTLEHDEKTFNTMLPPSLPSYTHPPDIWKVAAAGSLIGAQWKPLYHKTGLVEVWQSLLRNSNVKGIIIRPIAGTK